MCCVPVRRNSRISSLTWTAYLCSSSPLSRRFEIPSHSLGSCISHTTQKKRKERKRGWEGGETKRETSRQSSLSPICLQCPPGRRYLSVKSQVTTPLAEPSEGRHFISHLPDCLVSIEIRKGVQKNHSPERSLLAEKHEISHIQRRQKTSVNLLCCRHGDKRKVHVLYSLSLLFHC